MRRGKEIGGSGGGRRGVERHRHSGEEGTKGAKLQRSERGKRWERNSHTQTGRPTERCIGIQAYTYPPTYV